MTADIAVVLGILVAAIVLLITDWVRGDVVAILVLVAVVATGLLDAEEALRGFSSEAVTAIVGLLIVSEGLVRSGVVRWLAEQLGRLAGEGQRRLVAMSSVVPGVLSGLISDIATVSLFVPVVQRLARRTDLPAGQLLLPIAMAALAGGNLTIIGASHNLVVNSLLEDEGQIRFAFFELAPVGLALLVAFTLYALFLSRRLLPGDERGMQEDEDGAAALLRAYRMRDRLWELSVRRDTPLAGGALSFQRIAREYGLSVLMVLRDGKAQLIGGDAIHLDAGDVLLVGGRRRRVERLLADVEGLELLGHPRLQEAFPASGAELIEVVVAPRSGVRGQTLDALDMHARHGLTGVALWRDNRPVRTDVEETPLEEGDGVLLYGPRERARAFEPQPDYIWLHRPRAQEAPPELRHLGPWAALVLLVVIGSAALDWVPIGVASLGGAAAMVLLRILSPREAYESVEWRTVALVGGLYPLGLALETSGAARLVSGWLVAGLGALGPLAVLGGILLAAMALTQLLHGAAVAVIMTPVALDAARAMSVDPKGLAVAVIVGAAATYLLPVGHPAPLLVQRPGGYAPSDYIRYGAGLVLITLVVTVGLVPLVWPL